MLFVAAMSEGLELETGETHGQRDPGPRPDVIERRGIDPSVIASTALRLGPDAEPFNGTNDGSSWCPDAVRRRLAYALIRTASSPHPSHGSGCSSRLAKLGIWNTSDRMLGWASSSRVIGVATGAPGLARGL